MADNPQDPHMPDSGPADANDPEAALHALAVRLLAARYPGYPFRSPPAQEPQLLVGRLPADLPVDIPLPAGSRILGSLIQGTISIVCDTNLSSMQVADFYRERLPAAGWSMPEDPYGNPSLPEAPRPVLPFLVFCQRSQRLALRIQTHALKGASTRIQLELDTNPDRTSPCATREQQEKDLAARERALHAPDPFPLLRPPSSAQQSSGSDGGISHGGRVEQYRTYTLVTGQR